MQLEFQVLQFQPVQRQSGWGLRTDSAGEVRGQSAGEFPLAWKCQSFGSTQAFNSFDEALSGGSSFTHRLPI